MTPIELDREWVRMLSGVKGRELDELMDMLSNQQRVGRTSIPLWQHDRETQRWDLWMGDDVLASVWQDATTLKWWWWADVKGGTVGSEPSYPDCVRVVDGLKPWSEQRVL